MALIPQHAAGKKLGGFELTKEVSASSVGATFVAKSGSEMVLLTKVHRHVAKSPQLCDALLAEAKAARALVHENIAGVVESGVADGEPYVAYEYAESETLASLLRKVGPDGIPIPVANRIVMDLFAAVEAAHAREPALGHGEIGPWCIHVGLDGRTRVTGFAIDRALSRFGLHYAKNLERLTYAAPERVKAMSLTLGPPPPAPNVAADTFSVAVLAWELYSRQRLFASRMEAAIIQKVLTGPIAKLKSVRPEVAAATSEAIARALSRDPGTRPTPAAITLVLADEVAGHDAVAQIIADTRGKAQSGSTTHAKIGFSRSITPKGFAAIKDPAASNGSGPAAAAEGAQKKRAQTLIGFTPGRAEAPAPAAAAPAPAPPIPPPPDSGIQVDDTMLEEVSTSDGDLLLEESTNVAPPVKPQTNPPPPPRGRPPPRQVTLLGIEPAEDAGAAVSPPAPAAAPPAGTLGNVGRRTTELLRPGGVIATASGASYELLAAIARGGMAIVWAARPLGDKGLSRLVAVKTMLPEVSDDIDFEKMFMDEMRVAARIKHDNVAEILDVGETDGVMHLVMEWVEGETLGAIQEAAASKGGIPTPILLRIAIETCAGLHAAHELKDASGSFIDLVHRDINPANVMVSAEGHVKLVDFGIAKSKGRMTVTRAGSTVKGKTPYLSPEQLGGLPLDRKSDLFSMGALFYLLASGSHPFRGKNDLATLENIAIKVPDPIRSKDVPADLGQLILRLLDKDPKKRFPTAAAVQGQLERIEASLPARASASDVAAFVRATVGDAMRTRRRELIEGLRTFDPAAATREEALADAPAQPPALQPLAPEGSEPPTLVDTSPFGAEPAADIAAGEGPTVPDTPLVLDDDAAGPRPPPGSVIEASPVASQELTEDEIPAPPRVTSPWSRLGMLIGIGVVVGIGIIFIIESARGPETKPPAASATPPRTAPAAPAPTPTPVPTPIETATAASAAPEPTASASAAPEPSETAAPPEPPPTAPPAVPPPTGKPPATGKPPPWKPPSGKPPQKPPKKHNPTTI
jgi:serine/threonine protein kinase